jgi:hypothetical protein
LSQQHLQLGLAGSDVDLEVLPATQVATEPLRA